MPKKAYREVQKKTKNARMNNRSYISCNATRHSNSFHLKFIFSYFALLSSLELFDVFFFFHGNRCWFFERSRYAECRYSIRNFVISSFGGGGSRNSTLNSEQLNTHTEKSFYFFVVIFFIFLRRFFLERIVRIQTAFSLLFLIYFVCVLYSYFMYETSSVHIHSHTLNRAIRIIAEIYTFIQSLYFREPTNCSNMKS